MRLIESRNIDSGDKIQSAIKADTTRDEPMSGEMCRNRHPVPVRRCVKDPCPLRGTEQHVLALSEQRLEPTALPGGSSRANGGHTHVCRSTSDSSARQQRVSSLFASPSINIVFPALGAWFPADFGAIARDVYNCGPYV